MTNRKQARPRSPLRLSRGLWAPLLVTILASTLGAGSPPAESLVGFQGHWRRIGSDPQEERLRVIEAAIADLSWVMRAVAGPVLRKATVPPEQYVFEVDASEFRMGSRGREPRPLALDGRERAVDGDRGRVEISSQRLATGIRTTWRTSQAHGWNTFELEDGGKQLAVKSTLIVTAISDVDPIAYVEYFGRVPEGSPDLPAAGGN